MIETFLPESNLDLYFTVVKFENNMGFSLTQNEEEDLDEVLAGEENFIVASGEKNGEKDSTLDNEEK